MKDVMVYKCLLVWEVQLCFLQAPSYSYSCVVFHVQLQQMHCYTISFTTSHYSFDSGIRLIIYIHEDFLLNNVFLSFMLFVFC